MLASEHVEELICVLASWDRQTLTHQLAAFASNFPVDFSTEFLARLSDEQIRHLFLAVCLQNQRLPEATQILNEGVFA